MTIKGRTYWEIRKITLHIIHKTTNTILLIIIYKINVVLITILMWLILIFIKKYTILCVAIYILTVKMNNTKFILRLIHIMFENYKFGKTKNKKNNE